MRDDHLFGLAAVLVPFSLISIGGGVGVLSGIQHEIVDVRGWISAQDFVHLFAISRASPGPGTMIATLIGWADKVRRLKVRANAETPLDARTAR